MDNFCKIQFITSDPNLFFWVFLATLIVGTYILRKRAHKNLQTTSEKFFASFGIYFGAFLIFIFGTIYLILNNLTPFEDSYPNDELHQINAAIKNTCFLDPLRKNCPTNLEEVLTLYPEDFKEINKHNALTYVYYPEENNYTLIARTRDSHIFTYIDRNEVTVFDQRLKGSEISKGLDFVNTPAYACGDKFRLRKPLDFPGPWNEIN